MKKYIFELPMEVRDYECDVEGIVNNANYLHYLEHTRHQFMLRDGVSFIELHKRGVDVVVSHIDIRYKSSLRSDEKFISCLNISKEGPKYIFHQDIYNAHTHYLCVKAVVEAVCVVDGHLGDDAELISTFSKYFDSGK